MTSKMEGFEVFCSNCSREREDPMSFRCSCGGVYDINVTFDFRSPSRGTCPLERYAGDFPYIGKGRIVSLGEVTTPLLDLGEGVSAKLEYFSPTLSFKDRGSATLVSSIMSLEKKPTLIREDSSGNAGASLAAYSARAGLKCRVYVPARVAGPKAEQIASYGAEVVKVEGSRAKVTEEAMAGGRGSYVGHVWHPYFRDGMRVIAYELAEALGWKAPDYVFVPVSAGTLLMGVIAGFRHLVDSGKVDRMPTVVAAQASAVSPLYHKLKGMRYDPPNEVRTVADALASTKPPLLDLMVMECRKESAECEAVSEEEIVRSWNRLATMGVDVEPASAVGYAAYLRMSGRIRAGSKCVIVLTGTGVKSHPPVTV